MWWAAAAVLLLLAGADGAPKRVRLLGPVEKMRSSLLWLRHGDGFSAARREAVASRRPHQTSVSLLMPRPPPRPNGSRPARSGGWLLGRTTLSMARLPMPRLPAGWPHGRRRPAADAGKRNRLLPGGLPLNMESSSMWLSRPFLSPHQALPAKGSKKAARLFDEAFASDDFGPVIKVSLHRNDSDTEKLERINNATERRRERQERVEGGDDPRTKRLREKQDTEKHTLRKTETKERRKGLGIVVSVGGGPALAIGAKHGKTTTDVLERTRRRQHTDTDTEADSKRGSEKTKVKERRDRASKDRSRIVKVASDLGVTLSNHDNRESGDQADRAPAPEPSQPPSAAPTAGRQAPPRKRGIGSMFRALFDLGRSLQRSG